MFSCQLRADFPHSRFTRSKTVAQGFPCNVMSCVLFFCLQRILCCLPAPTPYTRPPSFHALFCHQSFILFDPFAACLSFFLFLFFLPASPSATFSPSFSPSPSLHAALFTVWKCLKLPATTYYKMHSSRAWISVWL